MSVDEQLDRYGLAEGAQRLALQTVIRVLVDHASSTDPGLRCRITAEIEDYIVKLGPQSDLEHDFAQRARMCAAVLMEPAHA